jgi:uncharacterized protein (DUF885 family)
MPAGRRCEGAGGAPEILDRRAAPARRHAADLSADNQVNLAVYRPQIQNLAAEIRFRLYEMPFNSDSQFWSDLGFMANRPFKTARDAGNYIARLNDVPRYFDEQIVNMRAGIKRGFTVPRAVLDGRDVSISTIAEVKNAEESDFYKPFKQLPAGIPADEQARLRAACVKAIHDRVVPSFAKLLKFFATTTCRTRKTLAPRRCPKVPPGTGSRSASTRRST